MSGQRDAVSATAGHVFHITARENLPSIRSDGVEYNRENGPDTETIRTVLEELGYSDPFPFNRSQVVFCHGTADYVKRVLPAASETTSTQTTQDVAIVVDVNSIDAPMYLADMSIITDLIDYDVGGPMMHAETPHEAVSLYQESITTVDSRDDVVAYDTPENGHPELLIDGDIPPAAIVDVVGD